MARIDQEKILAELGITEAGVSNEVLAKAGIVPFTKETTGKQLDALIKQAKEVLKDAAAPAVNPDGSPATPVVNATDVPEVKEDENKGGPLTKAPKSKSVDIIKGSNIYVRTYSEEVHGPEYFELAQQLVSKEQYGTRDYKLVDSAEIPKVVVLYREKEDFEKPLDDQDNDAPFVDKERSFTDKTAAVSFNIAKKGTIVTSNR